MKLVTRILVLTLALALPVSAQQRTATDEIARAEFAISEAERAGAAVYAKSLYDEAMARLASARQNATHQDRQVREAARLDALEANLAAEASLAKARWIATAREANDLREEILRFGGSASAPAAMIEEPNAPLNRGTSTEDRIQYSAQVIDTAREAGVAGSDPAAMKQAEEFITTARTINRSQKESDTAEYLAYAAEMAAREAYYEMQRREIEGIAPGLRLERTRLAEVAQQRAAEEERARREQAEREAAALREQLETERAGTRVRQAEIDNLRVALAENERRLQQQFTTDREARIAAEARLDQLARQYEQAFMSRNDPAEMERLRRQIADQQLALGVLQERERTSEQKMQEEILRLRTELDAERRRGSTNLEAIDEREDLLDQRLRELDQLRQDRETAEQRRQQAESAFQDRIATLETQARASQEQRVVLEQQVQAERARAAQAEAELARIREETARREEEQRQRIRQMEETLSGLAETRRDERGFIVTLPGIFFDVGKSQIKAGSRNTLLRIAEQLRANPQLTILVEGHTDSTGSEELNQRLSEARAAAVLDVLVQNGVPQNQISAVGKGEGSPIATNDTVAGRQQNRRVELVLR
ncbi:MAG TPA: OmpA family protein [Thermoanaerobaculia bacterium]|nr:OmpA family protein [Thermoanaerobaculia bacterium]